MKRNKIRNKILKGITLVAILAFALSACCFDSDQVLIPVIICVISGIWLFLFCLANGEE